jgi:hypothetical protein
MPDPFPSIKAGPVTCRRCKKISKHLVIEDINGIKQLRVGFWLIPFMDAYCTECGTPFRWDIREKDLSRMAAEYGRLREAIQLYLPE